LTRRGKHHVEEHDSIKNVLPEQEHARPMTGGGMTHNVEETERRFAGEMVAWLLIKAAQHEVDHLVIFAPPRMLGVLRRVPLGALKGCVEEFKGDLMRLSVGQLADHPMVRKLVTLGGLAASVN
jgi:protein required for attachment to host cells